MNTEKFTVTHCGVTHEFEAWTSENGSFCEGAAGAVCWNASFSIDEMKKLAENKVKETFSNELSHFFTHIS